MKAREHEVPGDIQPSFDGGTDMKIQTQIKAGGIGFNHNQTLVTTAPGQRINHNQTQVRKAS